MGPLLRTTRACTTKPTNATCTHFSMLRNQVLLPCSTASSGLILNACMLHHYLACSCWYMALDVLKAAATYTCSYVPCTQAHHGKAAILDLLLAISLAVQAQGVKGELGQDPALQAPQ